jgi:hypothetical protein
MDTPRYLRREGTDLVFVATEALLGRKDMKPYYGPVPFRKEAEAPTQETVVGKGAMSTMSGREDIIFGAVSSIPRESFVAPAFGRPARPRLEEVKDKTGFDVTLDEVLRVVRRLGG